MNASTRFGAVRCELSLTACVRFCRPIATSRARRVITLNSGRCTLKVYMTLAIYVVTRNLALYRSFPTTQVRPHFELVDFVVWTVPFPLCFNLHVVRLLL